MALKHHLSQRIQCNLILKSGSSHEINFKSNESYKENFTIKCSNENNTGNFISNSGIIEISGVNTKTTKICSIYLDEIFKLKISTIYVFNELTTLEEININELLGVVFIFKEITPPTVTNTNAVNNPFNILLKILFIKSPCK